MSFVSTIIGTACIPRLLVLAAWCCPAHESGAFLFSGFEFHSHPLGWNPLTIR
jgi:hypothetical protein